MSLMFNIKPWPLTRALINGGAQGVYILRDGYVTVQLPAEAVESEFPDEIEFDALPSDIRMVFDRGWAEEFKANYASKLIKSDLSNE
jgi:hypothetical protein